LFDEVGDTDSFPKALVVSGAGTEAVNGVYEFEPHSQPRSGDTLGCNTGVYVHTSNLDCWIGFQDCRRHSHPEWNKWVLFDSNGVLYAAFCPNKISVPPRVGKWELVPWATENPWQKRFGDGGAAPPPRVASAMLHSDEPVEIEVGDKFSLRPELALLNKIALQCAITVGVVACAVKKAVTQLQVGRATFKKPGPEEYLLPITQSLVVNAGAGTEAVNHHNCTGAEEIVGAQAKHWVIDIHH